MNEEFVCINPYHYVGPPGNPAAIAAAQEELEQSVQQALNTCVRKYEPLPGEALLRSNVNYCFCMECRQSETLQFAEDRVSMT
eukprot:m.262722 g.262722  ORF g.262722 m.262722 type:complete len:83 (+) comp19232_c3_seq3:2005-2253(+)